MEAAYHAAIYLLWTDWTGPHWFRGQRRDTWPLVASIHRGPASDSEAALAKVASFCEYVAREYPAGLSEIQRVAIAQHYGVETWLLDATRSYWVALYFASKGGEDGDAGLV